MVARHAPSTVTPASGPAHSLGYDGNGNILAGLGAGATVALYLGLIEIRNIGPGRRALW